jgi:hypothetical protein
VAAKSAASTMREILDNTEVELSRKTPGPASTGLLRRGDFALGCPVLLLHRKLSVLVVIISTCVGCGGGAPSALEVSPVVPPPARAPMQDQRILLEPIVVGAPAQTALAHLVLPDSPQTDTDADAVQALHHPDDLARRAQRGAGDLRVCWRQSSLAATTESSTELVLNLEIDGAGRVLGGATSPGGGEAGLSAVADCLLSKARLWAFPGRTTPGSTVLVVPYQLVFDSAPTP